MTKDNNNNLTNQLEFIDDQEIIKNGNILTDEQQQQQQLVTSAISRKKKEEEEQVLVRQLNDIDINCCHSLQEDIIINVNNMNSKHMLMHSIYLFIFIIFNRKKRNQ